MLGVLQLLQKWDAARVAQRIEIAAQVARKIRQRLLGLVRIRAAQRADAGECVVEKVRLNLAEHDGDTLLEELLFLLLFVVDLHGDVYLDQAKRRDDMRQSDLTYDRIKHDRGGDQKLIAEKGDRLAVRQHPAEIQNDGDDDDHRQRQKEEIQPRIILQTPGLHCIVRRENRDHDQQQSVRAQAADEHGVAAQLLGVLVDVADEIGAVKNQQRESRSIANVVGRFSDLREKGQEIQTNAPVDHVAQKSKRVERQHPKEIGAEAPPRMTAEHHARIGGGGQDREKQLQHHADRCKRVCRHISTGDGVKGHDHQREHNTDCHKTADARSCSLVYPHSRVPPHPFDH